MEPGGAPVARYRRAPFAGFEQPRLFVLQMNAATALADQIGVLALALWPADARPGDRGHVAALLAWHMEEALVGFGEGRLDAGIAFQGRRRNHEYRAPAPEGGGALDGEIDRIALAIGVAGIAERISHPKRLRVTPIVRLRFEPMHIIRLG